MPLIIVLLVAIFFTAPAFAGDDVIKPVAVVNDQIISSLDLQDRINLIVGMANIKDTPEMRTKIVPQIIHQMVDELLQQQNAAQNAITISDEKLQQAIATIEKQNNKQPGSLEKFLEAKKLSKQSFYDQVKSQIAWSEIVNKKVRPLIRISDAEVARFVKRKEQAPRSTGNNADEVMIEVIQLPVESPKQEESMRKLAENLVSSIKSGSSFEAVASQFSSGTSSVKFAEPFWVEVSSLDPIIASALAKLSKDGVSEAVRTANGYQIVKIVDLKGKEVAVKSENPKTQGQSQSELLYKHILMKLKDDSKTKEAELLIKLAEQVAKTPGKCDQTSLAGADNLQDLDFTVNIERKLSSDITEKLRNILTSLQVGKISDPVITPQGVHLFMLCEITDLTPVKSKSAKPKSEKDSDETIRQLIWQEKLELEAQKYMRNLRKDAFIEVRN